MAERWLVTGGSGQVGHAFAQNPPPGVEIFAPSRRQLDLACLPALEPVLEGVSAIVNCGAYTAVDRAEGEPDLAAAVNAIAPARLAEAAAKAGIPIVQLSTDYVFAVDGKGPWREDAPMAPASVYGQTKAEGEAGVRASGARHAIVRTAWVVSAHGHNFVRTMLRLGAERDFLRVVSDQHGSPTHAGDLAGAVGEIAARLVADPAQPSGTWHCTNAGETSWHALALHIFASAGQRGLKIPSRVEAIATSEYPAAASRPADSRLDCHAVHRDFGIRLRSWQDAVTEIVGELAQLERAA